MIPGPNQQDFEINSTDATTITTNKVVPTHTTRTTTNDDTTTDVVGDATSAFVNDVSPHVSTPSPSFITTHVCA